MTVPEATEMIASASLGSSPQTWLDLGCGSGTFTIALASLLPAASKIIAVDRTSQNLPKQSPSGVVISFLQGDMKTMGQSLPASDGILMANSLHYIEAKPAFIRQFCRDRKAHPAFIIVEYDTMSANSWVPFPINFAHLSSTFLKEGFKNIRKLSERTSIYGGKLYAAHIF